MTGILWYHCEEESCKVFNTQGGKCQLVGKTSLDLRELSQGDKKARLSPARREVGLRFHQRCRPNIYPDSTDSDSVKLGVIQLVSPCMLGVDGGSVGRTFGGSTCGHRFEPSGFAC